MNSRNKGKVGELEFASLLRDNGFEARRGQQFSGGAESPDIVCRLLSWLHIEVKRCERIDLRSWCAQAEGDCGGKPWVIVFRWNHGPWLHVGRIDLLFGFIRGELPPATDINAAIQRVCDEVAERNEQSTSPQPNDFPSPPQDGGPIINDRFAKRGPQSGEGEEKISATHP